MTTYTKAELEQIRDALLEIGWQAERGEMYDYVHGLCHTLERVFLPKGHSKADELSYDFVARFCVGFRGIKKRDCYPLGELREYPFRNPKRLELINHLINQCDWMLGNTRFIGG